MDWPDLQTLTEPTKWKVPWGGGTTFGDIASTFGSGTVNYLGEHSVQQPSSSISQQTMEQRQAANRDPSQFLVNKGAAGLNQQLMQANAPYFAAIDQATAQTQWAAELDKQQLGLKEQSLRGDIGAKQQANALDVNDVSAKRKRLGMEPGFIERAFGLDTRSQANAEGKARDQFGTGLRNLYSDATARGALTTQGARDQRTDLSKQLMRNIEDINVDRGRSQLGKERSLADTQQAQALLDTEAKKIGLNGADLQRQLDEGLKAIGLEGQINAMDLAIAMSSADVQKVQKASEIASLIAGADRQQLAEMGKNVPTPKSYTSAQGVYGQDFTRFNR